MVVIGVVVINLLLMGYSNLGGCFLGK